MEACMGAVSRELRLIYREYVVCAQAFGRELPGTLVFDFPSIPSLAAHLHSLLAPAQPFAVAAAELITSGTLLSALPSVSASSAAPALMALHIASRMPQLLPASTAASCGNTTARANGDGIATASLQRWDLDGLRDGASVMRVRFGGFIAGVEAFDAAAFGITPPEALLMDPQQRLLMEVRSWVSFLVEVWSMQNGARMRNSFI